MQQLLRSIVVFILSAGTGCTLFISRGPSYDYSEMDIVTARAHRRAARFVNNCVFDGDPVKLSTYTRIDSLVMDREQDTIDVYFNRFLGHIPMRQKNVTDIYEALSDCMGWRFAAYGKRIHARQYKIEELIPNYFRTEPQQFDHSRLSRLSIRPIRLIRKITDSFNPENSLAGNYIALWHSHGWYYEQKLQRWEWQRARLFQTVEDLGPLSYTLPYLVPMLENAGAIVFLPRERDLQVHEVLVDNDSQNDTLNIYSETGGDWFNGQYAGFAVGEPPYDYSINPFRQGTYRQIRSDTIVTGTVEWIPDIPETGEYAVYISWFRSDSNIIDAHYTVYHTGGRTAFLVNQQIGGQTWIYLGTFSFKAGRDPEQGKVVLDNRTKAEQGYITADGVRFGGGMGNIQRGGQISGRPRFTEGARYYLQYAGMPDSLVFSFNNEGNDYRDDYQSRAEWVNYLRGRPFGPNSDRNNPGLGIPIDLSLAFHTDAGITADQSVIGTLSIYSTYDMDSALVFPDTMSRLANRDLADIMQSQIVSDLRSKYDSTWTRRDLWDRQYHEAFRPNVPSVLLELLSHQNFVDMQFALDPRFRFDVSRAIYKAILRFITTQEQRKYTIQPLPVSHVAVTYDGPNAAWISWEPVLDQLEPTAVAKAFRIYTRKNDQGFDNGVLVKDTHYRVTGLKPGIVYGFKISAVNEGGESFPSETVALGWPENPRDTVLVVNAFDRVASPAIVATEAFQGFFNLEDEGVADRYDVGFTGKQFNFNPDAKWRDDDAPGFGASYADLETSIIAGNTFDFIAIHGRSLMAAGYAFASAADEVIAEDYLNLNHYRYLDLIVGEEKATQMVKRPNQYRFEAFPADLKNQLESFLESGGRAFISGAYIGTELFSSAKKDSSDILFAQNILRIYHRTDHAVNSGGVNVIDPVISHHIGTFSFNTSYDSKIYRVEAPDAIEPYDSTAQTLFRYAENNMSAGVGYKDSYHLVILGFPFETVLGQESRNALMRGIFNYLE